MATAQATERWSQDFAEDASDSSWSSEDATSSSSSGGEDDEGASGSKRGLLDISWSEFSRWPEDIINEAAEYNGPLLTLKIHHNVMKEIPLIPASLVHLVHLDVSNNHLATLPPDLVKLRHLRVLEARNNLLDDASLPKDFRSMRASLRIVNLAGNEFETLPPQLCQLNRLKSLFLGGNKIRRIPVEVEGLRSLETLYLGGNRLEHVPATLGRLSHLRALSLCNNRLVSIPPTLANLKRLKSLSLHGNRLTTLPQEIVNVDLRELSLRDNPLVNRFVSDLNFSAPSLRELAARVVKINGARIHYSAETLPRNLVQYLETAQQCVNPRCAGVYFDTRVEHVNFVDFCGKYRLPLLQYLCTPKCSDPESPAVQDTRKIAKVLLG